MPGLFPNPSAAAENFKVGDQVRWMINGQDVSPYIGVVTQICPSIQKVWVEFPIGGNQQRSPEDLIMVTPFTGQATVTEDTGYSDYAKKISDKTYGTLAENTLRMAQKLVAKKTKKASEDAELATMATKVASSFASDVVEKLSSDVLVCIDDKLTDIQAYQRLYPKYANMCSDGFMRTAIQKIYEVKNNGK